MPKQPAPLRPEEPPEPQPPGPDLPPVQEPPPEDPDIDPAKPSGSQCAIQYRRRSGCSLQRMRLWRSWRSIRPLTGAAD